MQDENGFVVSEREILKEALGHMSEALGFLFETESCEFQALAFMLDSVIKLGTVLYNDPDKILDASASWQEYEDEIYDRFQRLRVIK